MRATSTPRSAGMVVTFLLFLCFFGWAERDLTFLRSYSNLDKIAVKMAGLERSKKILNNNNNNNNSGNNNNSDGPAFLQLLEVRHSPLIHSLP